MSFHEKNIANKIEENWDSFPYKLDYIMYVIYTNNAFPSDIRFRNENGLYSVELIKSNGRVDKDNIDYKKYPIEEKELFDNLNYEIPNSDYSLDFAYKTKIFNPIESFRCNAQKDYLSLRFLDSNIALPNLFAAMSNNISNQSIHKPCQHFNDKVNNYSLYVDLNKKIPDKAVIEKKNKI